MKYEKATKGDIGLSLVVPVYGLLVGVLALLKGEFRRALTMMILSALVGTALVFYWTEQSSDQESATTMRPAQLVPASLEERLAAMARAVDEGGSTMINSDTRLDSAESGPGLRLKAHYTLVNYKSTDISNEILESRLTPAVKHASCTNRDIRPLLDQGVIVINDYKGSDGNPIGVIGVTKEACNESR